MDEQHSANVAKTQAALDEATARAQAAQAALDGLGTLDLSGTPDAVQQSIGERAKAREEWVLSQNALDQAQHSATAARADGEAADALAAAQAALDAAQATADAAAAADVQAESEQAAETASEAAGAAEPDNAPPVAPADASAPDQAAPDQAVVAGIAIDQSPQPAA